jgi:triosephosphate isomerase
MHSYCVWRLGVMTEMMVIIAGNWKMNMDRKGAKALIKGLADWHASASDPAVMVVFPPAVLIDTVVASLGGGIAVGGQDCHAEASGAHTGDIAAPMLAEAGCQWVLAGHSERRQDHGETSEMVAAKVAAAVKAGLKVMICVGETLQERESGKASDVVAAQILASLPDGIAAECFAVAYEPVWAIGTGKVASPEDVNVMHNQIRTILSGRNESYAGVDILYGGSVKPDNAAGLMALKNVGGALVGGASLKVDDFCAIADAALAAQ